MNLNGTTVGYKPQWRETDKSEWKNIDWKRINHPRGATVDGVPFPAIGCGILTEAWLMGYAQAQTVAWGFAADYEATHYRGIEVRVVPYDIKYSIEFEERKELAK
jgi:hypothetical protein